MIPKPENTLGEPAWLCQFHTETDSHEERMTT